MNTLSRRHMLKLSLQRLSAGLLAAIFYLSSLPFPQLVAPVALASAGTIGVVSLAGCSQSEIQNSVNTVVNSALAIIKVAEPGAPWVGDLANSIAALQATETQWQAGGAVTLIDDALNTVSAVLAVIPTTAQYAPLIALLVAGIEAVLALIPQPSAIAPQARTANPYHGRATLTPRRWYQTRSEAYRVEWNQTAMALGLAQAKI